MPIRFDGITIDVTDRKSVELDRERLLESERAARAELERANQMKDEFLATLSHELRTPLNAILGWSQILRSGQLSPAEAAEGIEVIERNARAQAQIIEDLLDMSRIISGKIRLDVQRVDLAAVVRAAIETIKPAADAKGIRLRAALDPLATPVSGDPNRLQQVFWNLLSNAVKFTPRDGAVQILLERVNSHLEVSVIDSGEGIDPRFLPHVFDRFRQADATTTRTHGGLGLGLAIVRQLVELHGGVVRAKSAGRGAGATFIVQLPLTPIVPDRETAEAAAIPPRTSFPRPPKPAPRLPASPSSSSTTSPTPASSSAACSKTATPMSSTPPAPPRLSSLSSPNVPTCWSATSACRAKTATPSSAASATFPPSREAPPPPSPSPPTPAPTTASTSSSPASNTICRSRSSRPN